MLYKKGTLKNFAKFIIKRTPAIFFNKIWASNLQAYWKKDSGASLFCKIWEVFNNSYILEHLQTATSGKSKKMSAFEKNRN